MSRTLGLFVLASLVVLATATNCHCLPANTDPPRGGRPASKAHTPCLTEEQRSAPVDSLCPAERGVLELGPGETCPDLGDAGWYHQQLWNHCVYVKIAEPCAQDSGEGSDEGCNAPMFLHKKGPQHVVHAPGTAEEGELAQLLAAHGEVTRECKSWAAESPAELLASYHGELATRYGLAAPVVPAPITAKTPVRVVVIDTAPTDTGAGAAVHGRLMAALVARAANVDPKGDCTSQPVCVTTELGLPRALVGNLESMNLERGGFYGYPSDVAKAIQSALQQWDLATSDKAIAEGRDPLDPTNERAYQLVINLSIGWEPGIGNTDMVATAIAAARCKGALVLVAAGNRHPRSCTTGLTGPGYYGGWAAPTAEECSNLETFHHRPLASGQAPLVHAVRAVDAANQPLATNRMPKPDEPIALDALGLDAIVASPWAGDSSHLVWLGPQSGSSAATALRAGQAAALWASHPDASADEIVERLQTQVEAIHIGSTAAPTTNFTPIDPTEVTLALDSEDTCRTTCTGLEETIHHTSGATPYVPAMLSSWVVPQPDDVVCPTCKIDKNTLYMSLSPTEQRTIVDVIVTISNASASEVLHLGALTIPAEPNFARYVDAELCRVGSTTSPPTSGWIDVVLRDATGKLVSLGNKLTIAATCP